MKDPNAATGAVFATYQRIPGVGSITLPDEAAPQNDIVTIDGSVGAAGFSGVGSATIPLPVLGQHPTHRFLSDKRRSGEAVQARIVKLAINVFAGGDILTDATDTVSAGGLVEVVDQTFRQNIVNQAREGMYLALGAPSADLTGLDYDASPAGTNATRYRAILNINDEQGTMNDEVHIQLAPGIAVALASADTDISIVQPGLRWDNIQAQVAQMGDGDFQSASVLGGNLVLRPNAELPLSEIIVGTELATDGTVS